MLENKRDESLIKVTGRKSDHLAYIYLVWLHSSADFHFSREPNLC